MPPREVYCDLCGGRFFSHSLPHHRKSCQKKVQAQMHECPYCNMQVTQLEMDSHVLSCKAAKAAGALPTGQSAQLRQRLARPQGKERGTATAASGRLISQTGSQGALGRETPPRQDWPNQKPTAYGGGGGGVPESDMALCPCNVCGRTFAMDRIAKHQAVCLKVMAQTAVCGIKFIEIQYCHGLWLLLLHEHAASFLNGYNFLKRPVFRAEKQRVFLEAG
ncbi:unnamed protein product [Effrenium voratum]|nr:unnamed protein product [Effrenium voratum]